MRQSAAALCGALTAVLFLSAHGRVLLVDDVSQSALSRATAQDWVLSGPGSTCASVCPTSAAVLFRTFSGDTARDTALCSATTPSGVQVIGFEEGSGCVVNANGSVVTSETYMCRCTEPRQQQGLALPSAEGTCETACSEGFEGKRGITITPSQSSNSSACMAQSAIGNSNHFGYTSRKGSCLSVESGSALASESFSCVCLFSSTNSAVAAGTVSSSSLG